MEPHASSSLDASPARLDNCSPERGAAPQLVISPEPTPEERRAIELALEELASDGTAESAWWRAGMPHGD